LADDPNFSSKFVGFDTGPGNVLMDLFCSRHWQLSYDEGGALAAQGRVVEPLLRRMLQHEYFSRPAPKSTGRDLFNEAWLDMQLTGLEDTGHDSTSAALQLGDQQQQQRLDILATLLALTAHSIALHLKQAQFPVAQARANASFVVPSCLYWLFLSALTLPAATQPSQCPL